MSSVVISGDTSGAITLAAPAVAGTNTINLPAAAGSVMVSGNMPAFSSYPSGTTAMSNATLTNNYVNNPFNVNDGGGNAISYNVYTLSISTPYGSSHRHQITRA
jgi:hypothetical protein